MNNQKSLIIHVCCAPCLSGLSDYLKSLGFSRIKGLFYNPNIHPFKEFKKRKHQVNLSEKQFGFDEFEYSDEYPLKEVLTKMLSSDDRCEYCFNLRLAKTAQIARLEGHTHFTTTLLISPYQNQELLKIVGNKIAREYNLTFLDEDMRHFYELSRKIACDEEMYQQGYCGCVFSEYARYAPKPKGEESV